METAGGPAVLSFAGIDTTLAWRGVGRWTWRWDVERGGWREAAPVPGPGRLAATAQAFHGRVYLFGGYTVAEDGSESSLPDVAVYHPGTDAWSSGAPMPVPVDDAVSGVWRDSLIVLVSGWHDTDNVPLVQIYDPAADRWSPGTPIPGEPVFGHAGAVVDDLVVYVDGVRTRAAGAGAPRFALDDATWIGRIDPARPERIAWTRGPDHPGPPLYRAAGGAADGLAVFVGGSDNPYNYDGIGYDGRPSAPVDGLLVYDPVAGGWERFAGPPVATMDHRSVAVAGDRLVVVGGMEAGRRATERVWLLPVAALRRALSGGAPGGGG